MGNRIDSVVVVKVGTNSLIAKDEDGSEQLDLNSFARIGEQVMRLQKAGTQVVIVSSAAITAGMVATGLTVRPSKEAAMPNLQRLASIGWRHVLNAWDNALENVTIGELLLTQQELDLESERDEVLRVTHALMSHGDVVVINENDAITHAEIAFGDNDTLAATFAARLARSALFGKHIRLVLLSDIHGVYEDVHDASTIIRTIDTIAGYKHLASDSSSQNGTGGMVTKFVAAEIATSHGVAMYIANGREERAIQRALDGEIGTHFTAVENLTS